MEALNNYMILIVVAVCLCVGYVLKHLVPTDKINPFIPLIMAVLGIFMNMWISGFKITPEILLGGMISGLASTGLYEAFKQFIEKK
ncbi:MAG: phage holin family protein [Clostridia bacterium]|nr:phage holin family protein [Clostridia bacterium]